MTLRKPSLALAVLAGALAVSALSACAPLVIGGAAVGTMVMLDRRTAGTVVEDEQIELRAASLMREAFGDRAHINTSSYNRQVLLTGEVPNEQDRQRAEQLVARVQNVRGTINELAVMGNTTLQQRSNDVLVTGKVKASIVDARELEVNAFRVVTERGTVYLMGRVTQREADKVTQLTRTIPGVMRVVRVFEYIPESEARGQQAPAPVGNATPTPLAPAPSR